jgi:hypothetical protein
LQLPATTSGFVSASCHRNIAALNWRPPDMVVHAAGRVTLDTNWSKQRGALEPSSHESSLSTGSNWNSPLGLVNFLDFQRFFFWLPAYIICVVQCRENDAGRKTLTESVNSLKDRGRQTLFFIRVMHYTRMIRHDYGLTWWSTEPTTALNLMVRMIFEMLSFGIVITLFLLNTILFPAKKKIHRR